MMSPTGKLLAWIEPQADNGFLAAYVGAAAAPERAPAVRPCPSQAEARRWIESQAAAIDLPIEWVDGPLAR